MGSDRVTDILANLTLEQRAGRSSLPQLLCERCRVGVPADAAALTLWTPTGRAGQVGAGLAEAFLLLRGWAYSSERPPADVAIDVLGRTLRFGAAASHKRGGAAQRHHRWPGERPPAGKTMTRTGRQPRW